MQDTMYYSECRTDQNISNSTRHIIHKSWLNENKKPKFDRPPKQSTVVSYFSTPIQKRIFVPENSDDFDFVKEGTDSKKSYSSTINQATTDHSTTDNGITIHANTDHATTDGGITDVIVLPCKYKTL